MSQLAASIRSRRRLVLAVGIPGSVLLAFMVAVPPNAPSWLRVMAFALGAIGLIGFAIAFFRVLGDVNAVRVHWEEEYGSDWLEQRGKMSRGGAFDPNGWYGLFGLASFSPGVDDYVRETARSYLALGAFLLCPAIVFTLSVAIQSLVMHS
jgi:hypothetical protein